MEFPSDFAESNERIAKRLVERHKRIVLSNLDAFQGKRVLDLASNNGRTWAALEAGASSVVGVEGRRTRVDAAERILGSTAHKGRYRFVCSDMYDYLWSARKGEFDTILCLGVYYHIMDHYMLMRLMARLEPEVIIIDSGLIPTFEPEVRVVREDPGSHKNALPAYEGQQNEFAGQVSIGLLVEMAANCGYRTDPVPWSPADCHEIDPVRDYIRGKRFTARLQAVRREDLAVDDWRPRWESALSRLKMPKQAVA
jgi:SAM-dependent methyltransferase